ncbi:MULTISPECIES: Flp family type IVb pilin [Bradyrhizobium]|uniref:Pilus assembly protein n=1 Tax=Bradyrhizobium canariense TaxID=255045 RepID=A0A1X3FRA4_9BRAD|nr:MULTISPECIES: Flp family type IVb pilin [Bradyrhizobium]OSI19755.1 pilus assembly protein [Bradyrhizobium canariense]OSI30817.1 pilus assembly protein [Bradyrhizobium canariense]OSI40413.1 pilus assembly protein [Bradyrhizobium canariense]OSI44170.1 pilus assembly protein [Bradyrhizobium canariense]OSI51929.1 pilus assembly protein [Bradyrhizobium canariense]
MEYGLIALAIVAVVDGLGSKLNSKFGSISASLK